MLTRGEMRVLSFVDSELRTTGFCPSSREISGALGMDKAWVLQLLQKLQNKGYVARRPRVARSIKVLRLPENVAA